MAGRGGAPVRVYPVGPGAASAYLTSGADRGEGYAATKARLFGVHAPAAEIVPAMQGFVTNYAATIAQHTAEGESERR